jgi:hypothetical protein
MIRDTRLYLAMNAIGALAALLVVASSLAISRTHPSLSLWLSVGVSLTLLCYFLYKTFLALRGRPIEITPGARGMTERQLWLVKGALAAVAAAALLLLFVRHR